MLRRALSAVTNARGVRRLATGGVGRRVALRFVAGESLDDAVDVVERLNADGAEVSLDYLGENVAEQAQAEAAAEVYREAAARIQAGGLRANVSVKLTQLGLDLDRSLAYRTVDGVVAAAAEAGISVTLDMEDHRYTDATLDACLRLSGAHPKAIGVAIQAYLKRTPTDLQRLIDAGVHVRLCKGAYAEPRALALQSRSKVSGAYQTLLERLMGSAAYPMIATHDEALIDHAIEVASAKGLALDSFEFQMLYGVRRGLQRSLIERGYRLRVYVPFGDQWYPYLTRRIAERPANARFFAEALLRR